MNLADHTILYLLRHKYDINDFLICDEIFKKIILSKLSPSIQKYIEEARKCYNISKRILQTVHYERMNLSMIYFKEHHLTECVFCYLNFTCLYGFINTCKLNVRFDGTVDFRGYLNGTIIATHIDYYLNIEVYCGMIVSGNFVITNGDIVSGVCIFEYDIDKLERVYFLGKKLSIYFRKNEILHVCHKHLIYKNNFANFVKFILRS